MRPPPAREGPLLEASTSSLCMPAVCRSPPRRPRSAFRYMARAGFTPRVGAPAAPEQGQASARGFREWRQLGYVGGLVLDDEPGLQLLGNPRPPVDRGQGFGAAGVEARDAA